MPSKLKINNRKHKPRAESGLYNIYSFCQEKQGWDALPSWEAKKWQ
jgi:hypothetical protein